MNKEKYDKHEHIPTEDEKLEEKFKSLIMPMRENSSEYFVNQADYLNALALYNEFELKSKSSVEEVGTTDIDRALADFKLHDAFNCLETYEDLENFRNKVKHLKVKDEDIQKIKENPFVINFVHAYSKQTNKTLNKYFGKDFSNKSAALEGKAYNKVILKHVNVKNGFRNKLPVIFNKINTEKYSQLEDKLSFLKAAPLPKDI